MRYKYAVVEPGEVESHCRMGKVVSLHKTLFRALQRRIGTGRQVRELVADTYVGDFIRYEHLRRWD